MAVNKALKKAIDKIKLDFGLLQKEIADKLGVKNTYLSDMINGRVPFSNQISDKIYELFQIEVDQNESAKDTTEDKINIEQGVPYWNLPVSAGRKIVDLIGGTKPDGYISGLPGADIAENILPITGTSMEPEISNGAIVGVKRMNNWETLNTERIYLIITHDDRMIKRIEHDREDTTILWCVSPNYPKFKIYKEDIIEIQRVCFVYNPK